MAKRQWRAVTDPAAPPLILGATGRLGRAFRMLHGAGLWPGRASPLWQHRPGTGLTGNALAWDMSGPPPDDPRLAQTRGIIVLAGVTAGDAAALAANTALARAAIALRDAGVAGPVLLMSSAAVHGRGDGPLTEARAPRPAAAYGAAKAAMEAAVAGIPGVTCLRLANVAGSDALFASMAAQDPVTLDRFADGSGPRRSYIGPATLARALLHLAGRPDLPPILNLASPGTVAMADLLAAAGIAWHWTPAPASAIARVELDTALVQTFLPLPPVSAGDLLAEARAAGWAPR